MKQKFQLEIVLLGIVSIISLASLSGLNAFEASATINTINSQTGPTINIVKQTGNTTVTNSSNTITIGIGSNVILKNKSNTYTVGAKQSFKPGAILSGLNVGTTATDPTGLTAGDLWLNTASNSLKYEDNAGIDRFLVATDTFDILSNKQLQDNTTGFINAADTTKEVLFSIANILTGHTDTWTFPNGNSTFVGTSLTQTITGPTTMNSLILGGQMNLAGNTMKSSGHVYTFPSNTGTVLLTNGTLTGTLSGGTISGTTSGTPTFSGTVTFTSAPTLSAGLNTAGNITSTAASGHTFKISAPSGVAICIGTGC